MTYRPLEPTTEQEDIINRDFLDGATWRRSSRSLNENAQCVEVVLTPHAVGVRDSKDPSGPALVVNGSGWMAFVDGVRGESLRP